MRHVRDVTADVGFDGIEFADPAQRLCRDRRVGGLRDLVKPASCMAPTCGEHNVALAGQGLEASIAFHVQNAPEVFEMRSRTLSLAVRCKHTDRSRWLRSTPGALLAGIDPETSSLRSPATGIEHRDRCVVGKQMIGGKHAFGQPLMQFLKPPTGTADPSGQRRTREIDAVAGEDLRLPIKRRVIAVFADQHLGEQRRRRQAAGDHPLRRWRLHHSRDSASLYGLRPVRFTAVGSKRTCRRTVWLQRQATTDLTGPYRTRVSDATRRDLRSSG
jgi:hypothetical protein